MTEPNEKLQGIDMKFVMKTDKISKFLFISSIYSLSFNDYFLFILTADVNILKARKEELKKLTDAQKTGYVEQMIRLKNGIGGEAFYCMVCILLSLDLFYILGFNCIYLT